MCRVVDLGFIRFYTSSKFNEKSWTKQIIRNVCTAQKLIAVLTIIRENSKYYNNIYTTKTYDRTVY